MFKKLFKNASNGKISWTKIGIWSTDIATFITIMVNDGIVIGSNEFWTKIVLHISVLVFGIGAADKADKMVK